MILGMKKTRKFNAVLACESGAVLGGVGNVLSIDPSGRALGWCLWDTKGKPLRCGVINTIFNEDEDWHDRNVEMVERVIGEVIIGAGYGGGSGVLRRRDARLRLSELYVVLIEQPRHFGGEVGGKGEGAMRSGAILKMYHLIGLLEGLLMGAGWNGVDGNDNESGGRGFIRIPVEIWKGQCPKSVTAMRVKRDFGIEGDHNMIDAVGIGRWWFRNKGR